MKPLAGGIKLEGKKEATLTPWSSVRPSPPRLVRIPLETQKGSVAQSLVEPGERVRLGQKIAEGARGVGLHASVSGPVTKVSTFIEIHSDGKDEPVSDLGHERRNWQALSKTEIRQILKESGVDLPHHAGTRLILNACESEPYLTSDHSLLMTHPVEILRAAEILNLLFEPREVILATEDNKEEVIELLKSKVFFHTWSRTRIKVLPSRYPQEDESILSRTLLGPGQEATVIPVWMTYAIYEAVVLQKSFYERIVTIAGECVAQPRNFWIRIGTLVEEAVKYARGFLRKPERVILGGPMHGRALPSLDVPVLKDTRGILGLPSEVVRPESVEPCIRCGRCLESCPVSISPAMITLAAEKELFDLALDYGARLCIECGNCSYVCPAKRPMVELIRYANAH